MTYRGYPAYVIIALPKCGTKSMGKCFAHLGYKVFDITQMNDHVEQFNAYGRKKMQFADFAKAVWEDNEYDVIIGRDRRFSSNLEK